MMDRSMVSFQEVRLDEGKLKLRGTVAGVRVEDVRVVRAVPGHEIATEDSLAGTAIVASGVRVVVAGTQDEVVGKLVEAGWSGRYKDREVKR